MLYTLDTEFMDNGRTIELLSIAILAENGREFYRQVVEADYDRANPWVRKHVLPQMRQCVAGDKAWHWAYFSQRGGDGCPAHIGCPWEFADNIAQELVAFVGESPTFLGYYSAYDHVALCQLFGTMMELPTGWPMYTQDLRQLLDQSGLQGVTQPEDDHGIHFALDDARWIMETYKRYFSEALRKPATFVESLERVINRHSMENGSDTPDFILANYLQQCLAAWDSAVQQRSQWYGVPISGKEPAGVSTPANPFFALDDAPGKEA